MLQILMMILSCLTSTFSVSASDSTYLTVLPYLFNDTIQK